MGKDKNFVRVHSMDVSQIMKEAGMNGGTSNLKSRVEIKTEEVKGEPSQSQWPAQPAQPAAKPAVEYALAAYDIALILLPVLLIVKAILCIVAAHKDRNATGPLVDRVSSMTLNLLKFNEQLVTIFTIVFVMIMAGLARRITLWKAQRGATVGELEQFQNSTSLAGVLKAIWSLRAFSFTSLALILAWSWYYLGSQAGPREYTYRNSDGYTTFPIALQSATGPSYFQEDSGLPDITSVQLANLNAEFTQDYVAQTDKAYDRTGAALVPMFGQTVSFPPYLHEVDKDGWQHTSDYSSSVYTSFVGAIPWGPRIKIGSSNIATSSYHIVGSYTFDTSYVVANCTAPTYGAASKFPSGVIDNVSLSFNMTKSHYIHTISARTFDLWNRWNSTIAFHSLCTLTTANVEVGIDCSANGCTATKIRPSQSADFISNRTPFDSDTFAEAFFNNLTLSSGIPSSLDDTTVLLEALTGLVNYRAAFSNVFEFLNQGDRPQGYASDLTRGMTQVINTYFAVSQPHATTPVPAVIAGSQKDANYATTNMHGAPYLPQYALSVPWLAVDFISNLVLLVAAIASFILRTRTTVADIFGYVSSLATDNPSVNLSQLPQRSNTMSGMQRARSMKHVRVKIGDVGGGGEGEAGRVGLTFAGLKESGGAVEMGRLDRKVSKKEHDV